MSTAIPIIDLQGKRTAIADQISEACREWGFFQIVNHGVARELVQRIWLQTHRFFALPHSQKLEILRTRENPRGYYDRELTKNKRDLKEVFDFGAIYHPELSDSHPKNRDAINGHNKWPSGLPSFKPAMTDYFTACEGLSFRLLEYFCLGLKLPANRMDAYFKPQHTSFIRLNYYPLDDPLDVISAQKTTTLGDMALHHHSDAGAFTILLQDDVGGLQVFAREKWWDVTPIENALVINTADMMQVWSNDQYLAPLHRVLPVTNSPRYSLPFFFNPSYTADCEPLESLTLDEPAHYRSINWGAFRQKRTDGDYANYGEEIQIDLYRIH